MKVSSGPAGRPDPQAVRRKLLRWYRREARDFFWRDGASSRALSPFQVLLVEFLLWKTEASRAEPTILRIVQAFPEPAAVLARSQAELEELLRPLGLFRRRAHCLLRLSEQVLALPGGRVPTDPVELARLTGIGQYAARATACLLARSRLMPIDANTTRIFARLFAAEGPDLRRPGAAWDERLLPFVPTRQPKRFLWATMDLGAACCVARRPRCEVCPLKRDCLSAAGSGRHQAAGRDVDRQTARGPG